MIGLAGFVPQKCKPGGGAAPALATILAINQSQHLSEGFQVRIDETGSAIGTSLVPERIQQVCAPTSQKSIQVVIISLPAICGYAVQAAYIQDQIKWARDIL